MQLVKGQNIAIDPKDAYQLSVEAPSWKIGIFINKDGKYEITTGIEGLSQVANSIFVNLGDVEDGVQEIVIYASREHDNAKDIEVTLQTSMTGDKVAICKSAEIDREISALEAVYLYRHNGSWKIKSFFQGYKSGLNGLLQAKGLLQAVNQSNTQSSTQSVGAIESRLFWSPSCDNHFNTNTAYLGDGFTSISNLNFCCLYVLKSGQRGIIHGGDEETLGSLHGVPFAIIESQRDAGVSILKFNSDYAHKMYKYIICAEMSEGSRNWADTSAKVDVTVNSLTTTQVIDSPLHTPIYVSCVVEVLGGQVTRKDVNLFFPGYKEVDVALGFSIA
jgi:uncharacterized protein involved in tellurium resistance